MARLPILMYHNVSADDAKSLGLTISVRNLEEQFRYISRHQFTSLFVSDLEGKTTMPSKRVVITFDDVTENQLLYALPLLMKYQLKATFFIPFSYLGQTDLWNTGADYKGERIMTAEQLKSLDPQYIELAHHSYLHHHYAEMTEPEIQSDFDKSYKFIAENGLTVYPALAYPYGNYPKKGGQKEPFFRLLEQNHIKMAFRIGNRVNSFPLENPYEIQRIDIKGEDSLLRFRKKLKWGKTWLF